MISACISVLLTMLLLGFCMIPGKRATNASEDYFTVHESRRALVLGMIEILMMVFLTVLMCVDSQSVDMMILLIFMMLWMIIGFPGIAFLLCYLNRKFIFNRGVLIYQNMWRKRKTYRMEELKMRIKITKGMIIVLKAREYIVSDRHGKRLFQFEENMTNAELLVRQFQKENMKQINEMMKYS